MLTTPIEFLMSKNQKGWRGALSNMHTGTGADFQVTEVLLIFNGSRIIKLVDVQYLCDMKEIK